MKKVLAVVLVLSLVFSVLGVSKVSSDTASFTLKRTITAQGGFPIMFPYTQFPVGLVIRDKDLSNFAALMYIGSTPQVPYVAQVSFVLPDGGIVNPTGGSTDISNPQNAYLFTTVSPQFKTLGISIHDTSNNADIQQITLSRLGMGQNFLNLLNNKPYDGYKGSFTNAYMIATDDDTVAFGGSRENVKGQISSNGSADFYGRVAKVNWSSQTVTTYNLLYNQQNSFAPQGAEVSIPLSLDGNILYLLVSRRGVIENGKIIAGSYSIWKIDLSQNNKIVAYYDAMFDKDDTYASFYPISFAQTAQDKIPVIEAVAKADLTTGAKVSAGNMYIATIDRDTLKVDDWLIDTGISQSKFVQAMYSNGIVVVMGNVDNNNDIIKAFDINKKQALWTATVPLTNFYLSQDGVVYLTSPNSVIAKDALTGNDLATYTLQSGAKYAFLFTADPSSNTIWVRYWDDNKKANCFAELSLSKGQPQPTTYTITATAGPGGSISPSGAVTVKSGDSATFTITPNSGYAISDVKVDGKSVGVVTSYTFTNVTADHTIEATFEKNEIVIVLQVGQTSFTVNGSPNTLDSPPIIKNGRTLLPIRPVVEALGGTVGWDGTERKVTVSLGSTTIELWIGKNTARVNGTNTPIDSTNSKVVPEIINGRTMLPLRFVTENLGCQLQWDPNTKTITITYGG